MTSLPEPRQRDHNILEWFIKNFPLTTVPLAESKYAGYLQTQYTKNTNHNKYLFLQDNTDGWKKLRIHMKATSTE